MQAADIPAAELATLDRIVTDLLDIRGICRDPRGRTRIRFSLMRCRVRYAF
jgi:hypothetical protein